MIRRPACGSGRRKWGRPGWYIGPMGALKRQFPTANPPHELDPGPVVRALFVALERWAADGIEPPPSAVPRQAEGTAVSRATGVAAYTGWNPRRAVDGLPDVLYDMVGSRLPSPATPAERDLRAAAHRLAEARFLLEEDLDLAVRQALRA